MEKLIEIIETKYDWVPEYKLACGWAELALNEGSETIDVVNFIAKQIFKKA